MPYTVEAPVRDHGLGWSELLSDQILTEQEAFGQKVKR